MSADSTEPTTAVFKSLSFQSAIGLAVPYGFACASLYLYAYWHPLGLNPFHYANAADLVSAALGGLVVSFALMTLGMSIGLITSPAFTSTESGDKAPPSMFSLVMGFGSLILLILVLIGSWLKDMPAKWLTTGVVLAILAPMVMDRYKWFVKTFPTQLHQWFATVLAIASPFAFYGQGATGIDKALDVGSGMSVDAARSDLEVKTEGAVMYIGMLGDFHVLRELSSNSTLLIPGQNRIVIWNARPKKLQIVPPIPAKKSV